MSPSSAQYAPKQHENDTWRSVANSVNELNITVLYT